MGSRHVNPARLRSQRSATHFFSYFSTYKAKYIDKERMSIQNLASYDPFADVGDDPAPEDIVEEKKKTSQANSYVHIRIQQRNGRKTLTTLQGLPKGMCTID